jgi:hypothetical protein
VKTASNQAHDKADHVAGELGSFDIRHQVEAHPWTALGVAALSGYVLGSMGGSAHPDDSPRPERGGNGYSYPDDSPRLDRSQLDRDARHREESHRAPAAPAAPDKPQTHQSQQARYAQPQGRAQQAQSSGILGMVMDQFGGELRTLTTAAVGTVVSLLRDTLKESVPQFAEEYDRRRSDSGPRPENSAPTSDPSI